MAREFAGLLRERVEIERPTAERTPMGVRLSGWTTVARCLAAVESDGSGAEGEGMALSAMPRFRVTIRHRDGIAVEQRLRWKGRILAVRRVIADPRTPDRLTLQCEEWRAS